MDRTDPTLRWRDIAEVLSTMPGSPEQLLSAHVDAGGGRCRACTQGGTGLPGAAWPCAVRKLAAEAVAIRQARDRRRP